MMEEVLAKAVVVAITLQHASVSSEHALQL